MRPVLTAFRSSPDRGRGLARDMRARWAFEEVGVGYDVRLLDFDELKSPSHRALQPFGQIPTLEVDGLVLFESAAIVLHVATLGQGLLPRDPAAHARAVMWTFAAVNTLEPPILERETARLSERDADWTPQRMPLIEARIRKVLGPLDARLENSPWLEAEFTAGDLMMVSVLQRLRNSPLLGEHPNLVSYVTRTEARDAYCRAFAAQYAVFVASEARRDPQAG